jgi:hypothetical protein
MKQPPGEQAWVHALRLVNTPSTVGQMYLQAPMPGAAGAAAAGATRGPPAIATMAIRNRPAIIDLFMTTSRGRR